MLKYILYYLSLQNICLLAEILNNFVLSSSKWLMPLKYLESNVFSFFNSFSTSKFFLFRLYSLASKSVFVTTFTSANLALKASAAKALNSGVVIYLSWLWSVSFFSISVIFVL